MTIPLLLSESIPKEIKNILKSLEVGQPARYKEFTGQIRFVCDEYIRICHDETSQKCLVVFENDWDDIEIEDKHFYNVKGYRGKIDDHPGNDLLPQKR